MLKKVIQLIIGKVYHTELSTSFSKNSQTYQQVSAEKITKESQTLHETLTNKLEYFGETCGKLFVPFATFVILNLIFSIYVSINLSGKLDSKLKVHFLNIGQGDAILIQTQNGNSMLIDSGPQNEKVIAEVQKFKNIFNRDLNILLATHADADHIGSMKKVMEKFNFQKFAFSGLSSDTKIFKDLMNAIEGQNKNQIDGQIINQKLLTLTAGMTIILDSKNNVRFDVLFPDFNFQIEAYQKCQSENDASKKSKTTNNLNFKSKPKPKPKLKIITKNSCLKFLSTETNLNSVVGKLTFGSTSFMLTGDAPIEVENFIIEKHGNGIKSDVLKLGHHGSKTSTSREFLDVVRPSYAIVSAGKDNRYGHPHKRVLDTISEYSKTESVIEALIPIQVLRTDTEGSIIFSSDGNSVW